jgi:hypothetical protein
MLASCCAPLAEIGRTLVRCVDTTTTTTTAARRMSGNTEDATLAEALDGTAATLRAAGRGARGPHRTLLDLHTTAWGAREVSAVKSQPRSGLDVRDRLDAVSLRLGGAEHITSDPTTLTWALTALTHLADRLIVLLTAATKAATRLSDLAVIGSVEETAHRDTATTADQSARTGRLLHRHLSTATARAADAALRLRHLQRVTTSSR